jgi:hypothetical protein
MILRGKTLPAESRRWPLSISWEISDLISTISPTFALLGARTRGTGFDILPAPEIVFA